MVLTAATTHAAVILDVSSARAATDPIQLGRLSRNSLPQDWSGSEPFPGVFNPTTPYRYRTYTVNVGRTPYIQISFDSISPDTFIAAYHTAYLPNSGGPNLGFDLNWLGDEGASGNFFGTDTRFFQVLVPANQVLVLVVNETNGINTGVGDPFRAQVEGFVDTEYSDVPEPASLLLGGTAVALAVLRRRRRG
jgi:hypothetical protein